MWRKYQINDVVGHKIPDMFDFKMTITRRVNSLNPFASSSDPILWYKLV